MVTELEKTAEIELTDIGKGMGRSLAILVVMVGCMGMILTFQQTLAARSPQYSPYSTEGAALWFTERL